MKAVVIQSYGTPEVLAIAERPVPDPGPSEIRVRVVASALNRADLLQRRGAYPAPPGYPTDIPGLEYSGVVEATGPKAGLWKNDDRVMGIIGGGAHAEYLCVHEREAIPVPEGLSLEDAAAIPEAFLTAYDALFPQMDLRSGERVLIHAVGSGVGTAAVQLARAAGATTLGTSRTTGKLSKASDLRLDHPILADEDDWVDRVLEATGGKGVNAVLDLVGGAYTANSLRVLSVKGRVMVVGLVAGREATVDLRLLLSKRARLFGTVLRSRPIEEKIDLARTFATAVVPLFSNGKLRPVIDQVLPFDRVADGHRLMEANDTFGKLVLRW